MTEPIVFTPYTWPMAFSPRPARRSEPVIKGSVMPASVVAGSITRRQSPYLLTLNRPYPPGCPGRVWTRTAMISKESV